MGGGGGPGGGGPGGGGPGGGGAGAGGPGDGGTGTGARTRDWAARLGGGLGGGAMERARASSSPGKARFSFSALTRMATCNCSSSVSSGGNS
jgi:hypothetical protein